MQGRRMSLLATTIGLAVIASSHASSVLAQQRPQSYGVYALVNGRLIDLPEAYYSRSLNDRVADLAAPDETANVLHDPPGVTFATGRISFVFFDRAAALGVPQAFVYFMPRIRAFVDRTVTPERRLDPAAIPSQLFGGVTGHAPPYWLVRTRGYSLRPGPYGTANDMVLYSHAPGFAFPPGRYRLRIALHNYDFVVGGATSPQGNCVDAVEWADSYGRRYPRFEDCGAAVAAPGSRATTASVAAPARGAPKGNAEISNWRRLRYPDDGFSVASPVEFTVQVLPRKVGMQKWYNAPLIGPYAMSIDVIDEPEYDNADQILAEARASLPRTIVGGTLRSAKTFDSMGYPGMELVYEGSDRSVRARAFVVGHRLYILHASSPVGARLWPDEERFLSSFQLLPR